MFYDVDGKSIFDAVAAKRYGNGVADALCVTGQICETEWTTTNSGMPKASNSQTIPYGTTTKGMPYSSASVEDGYIGISISLYTFMSAVANPSSVLYSVKSKGYTGYAYYGTVCTSLVCAAWGLPCLITTAAFPKWDDIEEVDFADLELGDMLLGNGHAMIISGLRRDSSGAIETIRTSESKYNDCITNEYQTYADFVSSHGIYTGYRYKHIDKVNSYNPSPFIRFYDEPETEAKFPDIMTCFGDKVTRKRGTDIVINVLDNTDYDEIDIYRDGELIDTKQTVEDFTITAPVVGAYEVRMVGERKSSSTYFDIVDCHISVSGNTVKFSTTYMATAIGGVPVYTTDSDGRATTWNNPKRVRLLTEEENAAKEIDITEFLNDTDCDGGIRLYVRGVYGNVSFEYLYA